MLESSRRFLLQFRQHTVGSRAQFLETGIGNEIENPLEKIGQRETGDSQHRADEKGQRVLPDAARNKVKQVEGQEQEYQHYRCYEGEDELLLSEDGYFDDKSAECWKSIDEVVVK